MTEIFDPSEWVRFSEEDVIFLRRVLKETMLRSQDDRSTLMNCVRLDNLLARIVNAAE